MKQSVSLIAFLVLADIVLSLALPSHQSCEGIICRYGAKCQECDGHLHCDCSAICDPDEAQINYLCGDDGKTYKNLCQLKVENCEEQTNVQRKHYGKCGEAGYKE